MVLRPAVPPDAERIAALHAASWQANYRGVLRDAYLDGPVEAERRSFWRERLGSSRAGQIVLLAEESEALAGFVCGLVDHDPDWGTLVDNLHVAPARKRQGLGTRLMGAFARHLVGSSSRPVFLSVLEANKAARGFYDRLGGEPAQRRHDLQPDGSTCAVVRYRWASPARLLETSAG